MKEGVSIIIPTYKVPEYLYECVESIKSQIINYEIEIIIGIDNCPETLNHVKENKEFYDGIKICYFNESLGPYIIKNNLVDVAKYEYILFFDSDDIMNPGMLDNFYQNIIEHNYVWLKFKNFKKVNGIIEFTTFEWAYGVFGITKSLFNKFVGFESWICNADVEFYQRLIFNNYEPFKIEGISFNRRLHEINLTVDEKTKMSSSLRKEYRLLINRRSLNQDWKNPIKIIKTYTNEF
jgi:glycosyltransferase involved in cell wall biosynthesis